MNPKIFVTERELGEMFSLSKTTIIALRKRGLPHVRLGAQALHGHGGLRYDVEEVRRWLTEGRHHETESVS